MLREYQLKNFKAFSDAAPLLLRPITLIYGPNSAGKSSIIQSLMLLKQTLEESESSDVVLLPKGKLVDLGNYREMVHLHEIDRQVSFKVQLDANPDDIKSPEELDYLSDTVSRIYKFLYSQIQEFPVLSLELTFSIESIRSDITLQRVQLWLGQDECPVIAYEKAEQGLKISELYSQHSFWQAWWEEYNLVLSNRVFNQINRTLDEYNYLGIDRRNQDQTLHELEVRKLDLLKEQEEFRANRETLKWDLASLKKQKEEISGALRALRAQQEILEKELKGQKNSLKLEMNRRLKEKLNSRLITFFSTSESVDLLIEGLGLTKYIDDLIKSQLSRQQTVRQDIQSGQRILTKEEYKKEIEDPEADFKQRLENFLEDFIDSLLQKNELFIQGDELSVNLNEEEKSWFVNYQHLHKQLTEMERCHEEVRNPLLDEEANLQQLIHNLEIQTSDDIDRRYDRGIQIVQLLQQLWQRFDNYSIQFAIEDFFKLLDNFRLTSSKFLLIEIDEIKSEHPNPDFLVEIEVDFLMGVYDRRESAQYIFNASIYASDLLNLYLSESRYLGPMRDYPERFYLFSGKSTKQVGKSGKGASDLLFEDPSFLEKVNQSLEKFDIGHEVKISSFQDQETDEPADVYAIRLIDGFSKVNVSLLDVGFGVSQVLPVIIQSLFSSQQTILIEQPEVHIHPRLQTELGDLFIESVKDYGNRFIVETHSEHLLLRIQRRVREGFISPDLISILYIDRDASGSQVVRIRLNSRGKFIDKWPGGFFDEDISEVFGNAF